MVISINIYKGNIKKYVSGILYIDNDQFYPSLCYIMTETNIQSLSMLRNCFKLGDKSTEVYRKIWKVECGNNTSKCTAKNWFKLFKGRDLSFKIKHRSGMSLVVDFRDLK